MQFGFRQLGADDLPTMHRWLNDPGVVRWWEGDDVSEDGVVRDYGPDRAPDGVEHWIADIEDAPVGWISCGDIRGWPEELVAWRRLGVDSSTGGIDYLVGDLDHRGRGLGSAMIAAFVRDIAFVVHPEWTQVGADPFTANAASWRALARAGFRHLGIYGDGDEECTLMVFDRRSLDP